MTETAVNLPFESSEIIDIAMQEFRKRLLGLSPLQSNKEYAGFSLDFQVKIHLRRTGEQPHEARETLAWGCLKGGSIDATALNLTPEQEIMLASQPGKVLLAGKYDIAAGHPNEADLEPASLMEIAAIASTFESKDPNDERIERDMPLTVEAGDGKGGKIRKKVRVSNAGKKAAKGA